MEGNSGKKVGGSKSGHGHGKFSDAGVRRDRKSGTGMSGEPKKGGHGGKFTWAGDRNYSQDEVVALETKDPNYFDDADDISEANQTVVVAAAAAN